MIDRFGSRWLRAATRLVAASALVVGCTSHADKPAPVGQASDPVLAGSTFEGNDGNLVVDTAGNEDWANAPNLKVGLDKASGKTDDSFGQGTSEDDPVPTVVSGSIPPNKSDLSRFYIANEHVDSVNKDFLYLAWERTNTLGSANMDFEFNQSSTLSSNGVTVVRTDGDILITYDFGGSGSPSLHLLRWVTTGATSQCEASSKLPCWGNKIDLTGFSEGAVNHNSTNDDTVVDPIPPNAPQNILDDRFGEAAINLTDSGVFPAGTCKAFGKASLHSRSSASFNAEEKDFIAPIPVNINNCKPVTIDLIKRDSVTHGALAGAVMQLWLDTNGNGTLDPLVDTQVGSDCTTPANGTCSFTVTANGTYIAHEKTPPPGYSPAPDQTQVVVLTSSTQTFTLYFDDTKLPGRINVHKTDDNGLALPGAVFRLYTDAGGAAPTQTSAPGAPDAQVDQQTTDASGNLSLLNVPQGDYWIYEVSAPTGYSVANPRYQHATVALGSNPNEGPTYNFTFSDPRKFHIIVMVCKTADNTLYSSSVSLNSGTVQQSITPAQATALGLDASKLCQITEAKFPDFHADASLSGTDDPNNGTYSVDIPK